ncbi:MAG: hypothetical protein U1F67_12080 [Rubrivivax sp.]
MLPICVRTVDTATPWWLAIFVGCTSSHSCSSTRVSAGVSATARA